MFDSIRRRDESRDARARQRAERRRAGALKPWAEALEQRVVMSTNTWVGSASGGDWDTASNWSLGVPTSGQDVSISLSSAGTVTHSQSNAEQVNSLTTNANTTLSVTAGSIALAASGSSSFGGPVTFNTGSSLTMGNGAKLAVAVNQVLTVNGSVSFGSSDTITYGSSYGSNTQINVNGSFTSAIGTTFTSGGGNGQLNFGASARLRRNRHNLQPQPDFAGRDDPGRGRPLEQHLQCAAIRARVGRGLPGGVAQRRGDEQ